MARRHWRRWPCNGAQKAEKSRGRDTLTAAIICPNLTARVSYRRKFGSACLKCDVAYWHIADNAAAPEFVRYWTRADKVALGASNSLSTNDPSRHWRLAGAVASWDRTIGKRQLFAVPIQSSEPSTAACHATCYVREGLSISDLIR
jgi:hypothetical protein